MNSRSILLSATMALAAATNPMVVAHATVVFIGEGSIPADAHDHSKLTDILENGHSRHDQVGGLGSAIDYSGQGNIYYALPDRGPDGGKTSYLNRLHRIEIRLTRLGDNSYRVEPSLKGTTLLQTEDGRHFTGLATAHDATNSSDGLRLDPEGIRVSACGKSAFICDEYGPHIYEIDLVTGKRLRALPVPRKFLIDYPSDKYQEERDRNQIGRQHNRGFEGLAITADGKRLLTVIQQPLLQDSALDGNKKPAGVNCRILETDLSNGAVREFVYPMEASANGLSEILAVNDHEFLVIEHDSKAAPQTTFKKIFRIDLAGATDVRGIASLPASGTSVRQADQSIEIKPVRKTLLVDLLNAGIQDMPEKVEGITFGPDLADGRHLLIASSDNDFTDHMANRFWAFAVDPDDVPGFQPVAEMLRKAKACPGHATRRSDNLRAASHRLLSHSSH